MCREDCNNITQEEYFIIVEEYVKNKVSIELIPSLNCVGDEQACQKLIQQEAQVIINSIPPACQNACGDGICDENPCQLLNCKCRETYINCVQDCGSSWEDYPLTYTECDATSDCIIVPSPGCCGFSTINAQNDDLITYFNQSDLNRIAFDAAGDIVNISCMPCDPDRFNSRDELELICTDGKCKAFITPNSSL